MSHRHRPRSALTALVAAAAALAALASPAAAAPTHGGHHGRHHHRHVWHHALRPVRHHWWHRTHHHSRLMVRRSHGLPTTPFLLRNRATGACLTAEPHRDHTVYALARCSHHRRAGLWNVDRASGALRNLATRRCVVPGYAEDFSCTRLAEFGRGYAVHRDAAGRIYYRAITGDRYLNLTHRLSGGYVFGATYTLEPKHSSMGREQRWTAKAV